MKPEEGKVRFILKREEVEITTPEEMEELGALKPEEQNRVRDFVSANEIYGRVETRAYDNELFEKLRRLNNDSE